MSDSPSRSLNIYVAACDCGRGLFAGEAIPAGTEILRFSGPELTLRQVRAKGDRACDALQIGIDRYLDLQEPGRLANHSCRPNAGVCDEVRLVALQPIHRDEEIRFDYSTTVGDGWTMTCRCGVAECRGMITAFQLLPQPLRLKYAILRLVQRFLVDQMGA